MKSAIFTVVCCVLAAASGTVQAANRWGLELRANTAAPLEDMGDFELNQGFGLEASATYYFMEHLGLYAGWGWQHFSTEGRSGFESLDVEETGYRFGLQFVHPIEGTRLSYLISGGGIFSHIELEDDDIVQDTGHGFGGEFGAGLVYPVNESLGLMADLRYHYLPRTLTTSGIEKDLDLSYLSCGISVVWSF